MKIKIWKKNIFITGALLSFFFLGGLSTAKAQTCDTNSLTVTGAITSNYNGLYTVQTPHFGDRHWHNSINSLYNISDFGSGVYEMKKTGDPNQLFAGSVIPGDFTDGVDTAHVAFTNCEPEPEPESLVGGFFFKTPPASALGVGVGTISTDVMGGLLPYIYIVGGLLIGFWLVEKIISLIPKDETNERADKEIARSERLIKEEKRIIATLD